MLSDFQTLLVLVSDLVLLYSRDSSNLQFPANFTRRFPDCLLQEAALESGFLSGPNAKTHGALGKAAVLPTTIQLTDRLPIPENHTGGFVDTCDHHCGSWASDASAAALDVWINGTSAGEAFASWYDGKVPLNTVWQQPLPAADAPRCTACCHKPAVL